MPNPVPLTSTADGTINLGANAVPVFLVFGDSTCSGSLGGHVEKGEKTHDKNLGHTTLNNPYPKTFTGPGFTDTKSDGGPTTFLFKYWDQGLSKATTVEWSNGTTYAVDDTAWVTSDIDRNYYRCIAAHSAKEPGSAADWEQYWTKTTKWMSDERLLSVYGARGSGRYYSNGAAGSDSDKFVAGLCRPRTTHTTTGPDPADAGWAAAGFADMHPYMGFAANRFYPMDQDAPDYQKELRDNCFLWTFGQWMLYNPAHAPGAGPVGGVFRDGTGNADFTQPHYVHFPVSGAAAHELTVGSVRRTSFSPDYAAPAVDTSAPGEPNNADQVSAYQQFNDLYLKPAMDAIQGAGNKPYIAGMIVALGSKDCSKLYNTTQAQFLNNPNGTSPASNVGPELVKITGAIKTALGITNVPTIYLDILQTETALPATDSSDYGKIGRKSLADAIANDPYAVVKRLFENNSNQLVRIGSDNVHLSATAMDKLGYELGELYWSTFVNKGLEIEEVTASVANITS